MTVTKLLPILAERSSVDIDGMACVCMLKGV